MKSVAVALINAIGGIGIAYILAATLVGADTLIPHRKYIVVNNVGDKK